MLYVVCCMLLCLVTSLMRQCYVLFEIHFSGSLMEANRSNKHFTKYDDLIRCSRALSGLSQTTSGRKVYFFTSTF